MNFCQLSNEEKNKISDAIISATMNDVKELYIENDLQHRNAYHMLVWDFIGTRVFNTLKSSRLKVVKTKRGRFSFNLIVDEQNATVYSIMKKSNVERIRNGKNSTHYLWSLVSLNADIPIREGQLCLFEIESDKNYFEKTKEILLKGIDSIINRYCTIIINDDNKQFPGVELKVFDINLNEVHSEIWKESFIDYSFDFEPEDEMQNGVKIYIKEKEDISKLVKIKGSKENKKEKEG